MEELLLIRRQIVEAGADDPLERLRKRKLLGRASLEIELCELLRVEGVAARAVEQGSAGPRLPAPLARAACSSGARCRSSESGSSATVDALSLPPPQFGRRASSSGRAVHTTSIGTSLTQSTSASTKSSKPSSAH